MTSRPWTTLFTGLLLTAALVSPAAAAGPEYVALGDSAAAGPLIPPQDPSSWGCLRTLVDYPHVAASKLGATLKDVTCSSATTAHLTTPQSTSSGPVAPQFEALSPSTKLVTLTIGANDIGLVSAALTCLNLGPEPLGQSCEANFTAGGHDQLADKITAFEANWGTAIDGIRAKSANAAIYVVGYGNYLPRNGCWPTVPVWARDANYLQATIGRLNAALARQAEAHGATFVDIVPPSVGHDTCQSPSAKWFEGIIPTAVAAPLHPNKQGMAGIGAYVASAIS
ncbi:SGNH/GDSL hydrolase family protein [Amycolatopsis sp. NPDC059657]|uniref:SGNH/GDSL hydrolase family protein n=1 Tax=Amycolatopsis sp. NPDC059657 TaxID=3346899 RepID=UPI00366C7EAA